LIADSRAGGVSLSLSPAGVLAYRTADNVQSQFEWTDRAGRPLGVVATAGTYTNFDLSPDAKYIAATARDGTLNRLWIIDVDRAVATPAEPPARTAPASDPTWSPDGRTLAFRRGNTLVTRPAFGGEERVIAAVASYPDSWSRDGRYLTVGRGRGDVYELFALRVDGIPEEIPLVTGLPLADEGKFSPDGRWVVFHASLDGGRPNVFAIPFPPTGERWQLSPAGGVQPRWSGDGREVLYLNADSVVMSVQMPNGDPRRAQAPVPIFRSTMEASSANDQFAVARDGRLLLRRPLNSGEVDNAPVSVLVNWRRVIGLDR
jgi:Tol biopolymer transport system component